jgi:hypothetical protein
VYIYIYICVCVCVRENVFQYLLVNRKHANLISI